MYNCKLDTLLGYTRNQSDNIDKLPNSIINFTLLQKNGIILPLSNSLRFYDGLKSSLLHQTAKEVSAVCMNGPFIAIG
jgi:hypothetical protein